jgi:predicted SnoaL-like aldol condensation-catalyzing enzyme
MADPEQNKQTVLAFLNMAFNEKKPAEAVENYGGSHYIQHNPQAPDGFEAFIQFVDLVALHSLMKTSPEDRGTAAADFFRLEDGKVVEHWDVLQPIPESAANEHPMF